MATTSTLVQTDGPIDYSLVQLPSNPTATYGFFQLRKEGGVANEQIYIPQHPQHWGKRIAVFSDNAADPTGYAELYLNASNSSGTMVWTYFADTQGGSSGSPVVASTDNLVVALHHAEYNCATVGNGGPEVEELISDLGGNLPQDAILYALYVTVSGLGSGTVVSTPSGINCPGGSCEADFGNDSTVTLTPSAGSHSVFGGWSGDADCSDGSVTMTSSVFCTATFDVETHTLSVATAGAGGGSVTSSPSGINCPGDCSEDYDHGQAVNLTSNPDGSSSFAGWSGDADCADGEVTMIVDVSCTATFDALSADLQISKTDGVTEATPGRTVVYTIVAANAGPSPASSVSVTDTFPAELTCSWTSVASGGATGNGSGSGAINETLAMLDGSSVTYTATCTVDPGSSFERLANTSTVTAPVGMVEPDLTDNSSTDANVGPLAIFGGCFESGGTGGWSATVGEV